MVKNSHYFGVELKYFQCFGLKLKFVWAQGLESIVFQMNLGCNFHNVTGH
jgi:hypothetical protein